MAGRLLTVILDRVLPADFMAQGECSVCHRPLRGDSQVFTVADAVYCSRDCLRDPEFAQGISVDGTVQ